MAEPQVTFDPKGFVPLGNQPAEPTPQATPKGVTFDPKGFIPADGSTKGMAGATDTSAEDAMSSVTGFETPPSPGPNPVLGGIGEEALGMVKGLPKMALGVPGLIYDQLKEIPSQYRAYEQARQQGKSPVESMKHVQEEIQKKGNALTALQQRVKELGSADSEVSARAIGKTIVDLVPIALGLAEGVSAAPEAAAVEAPAETAILRVRSEVYETLGSLDEAMKPPGIVKQITKGKEAAAPQVQEALSMVDKDFGEGPLYADSFRTINDWPIKQLENSATSKYARIDAAAGTDFKALNQKLENTEYQLGQLTETSEDLAREATLTNSRQAILDKIAAAKQQATANGVNPDIIRRADAHFKQAKALRELDAKVLKNPSIVKGNFEMGTPETVDVDAAVKALQKMQDNTKFGGSRLEQAIGKDRAEELLKKMYEAQRLGAKSELAQKRALFALKVVGYGASIGGGIEAVSLLSGK